MRIDIEYKLKKRCDSLLTEDLEGCKEQKSKLDLIRWMPLPEPHKGGEDE